MNRYRTLPAIIVVSAMLAAAFTVDGKQATPETGEAIVAVAAIEGGFQLTASLPSGVDADGDAVVIVTTRNCAEPKNARVTGRVVTWGDDGVETAPLKLRNVGEGRYAVDQQWTAKHALLVFDGSYTRYTSGLLVGLDADTSFDGQGRWVGRLDNGFPTQLLDRHVRDKDVKAAMTRMRG